MSRRPTAFVRLVLLLGGCSVGALACADVDARHWLAEMTAALAQRSYAGEFLHIGDGPVERLRIFHRVRDGHVAERLVGVGQIRREVVRHDEDMQVILADQQVVLLESAPAAGSLLGSVPTFEDNVEDHYRVENVGEAHVIGRPTRVIAVVPRDAYRFGYRLWIDEASNMPLRTDLTDAAGHLLEQVVFTSLELGAALPEAAFHASIDASHFAVVREQAARAPEPGHDDDWTLSRLPPGFRILSRTTERLPGTGTPATHLLVGDGLASVSVFIEEPPAGPRQAVEGEGKFGSANAYSHLVAGHQVTAVGEVPVQTVQLLAAAVMPAGHASPSLAPFMPAHSPSPLAGEARPAHRP